MIWYSAHTTQVVATSATKLLHSFQGIFVLRGRCVSAKPIELPNMDTTKAGAGLLTGCTHIQSGGLLQHIRRKVVASQLLPQFLGRSTNGGTWDAILAKLPMWGYVLQGWEGDTCPSWGR